MLTKEKYLVSHVRLNHLGSPYQGVDYQELNSCLAFRLCEPSRFLLISVAKTTPEPLLRGKLRKYAREGFIWDNTKYAFLGYTEYQVTSKKSRMMFFKEGDDYTARTLRASFGDFESIFNASGYTKYSTLLQLPFTSAVESWNVPQHAAVQIDDIKAPDGSIPTNGIGLIRDSFAKTVCSNHKLPSQTSAFQVCRGGIRGVLVRYPDDVFDKLAGKGKDAPYMIAYRPSMAKFHGGSTKLELVNVSHAPNPAHLNVQLILLLLTLGVPLDVFERLLEVQLALMNDILTDRERAMKFVRYTMYGAPDEGDNWAQRLYRMLEAQQPMDEPHMHDELGKYKDWHCENLKRKLNLYVENAAYVVGVIDEIGVLEEGEVFIKLPEARRGGREIVGDVVVTRMPCFSTGDVRKFRAVASCPGLDHLENVVVFSRKGNHSIPDTMASGDLDGDLYLVIWERSLIPPKQAVPLHRSQPKQTPEHRLHPVERMTEQAVNTFVKYRHSGALIGKLYNKWLEAAQATPELADSPLATQLVALNESALDMVKLGRDPRKINQQLWKLCKEHATTAEEPEDGDSSSDEENASPSPSPSSSPDSNSGPTTNPIARLRALIGEHEHEHKPVEKPWTPHPSLILKDEDPALWEDMQAEAERVMKDFNRRLAFARRRDERNGREMMDRGDVKHTVLLTQEFVKKYFSGTTTAERAKERMRASAWYEYAYREKKVLFGWLGSRYLNEIRARYVREAALAVGSPLALSDWDEVVV